MMAQIRELSKKKQYIEKFHGYCRHYRIEETQAYDCYNLSNREYPILCSKEPRGVYLKSAPKIYAMSSGPLGIAEFYTYTYNSYCFRYNSQSIDHVAESSIPHIVRFGQKMILCPQLISRNDSDDVAEEKKNAKMYDYTLAMYQKKQDGTFVQITSAKSVSDTDTYKPTTADPEWFISYYSPLKVYVRNEEETGLSDITATIWTAIIPKNDIFNGENLVASDINKLVGTGMLTITDSNQGNHQANVVFNSVEYTGITVIPALISSGEVYKNVEYGTGIEVEGTGNIVIDFAVECQNRIWACRYGNNVYGDFVNEIYATELGTSDEWMNYSGDAAASYAASIGTHGAFTGAAVLGTYPYFFKEKCIHKVYVSSSGAHQVRTLDVPGVENGSYQSIVSFGDYLIYKGCDHVYLFDGSGVVNISDALGEIKYKNAIAGRSKDLYVMYCENEDGKENYIFSYDTRLKLWQRELIEDKVTSMCEHNGELLIALEKGKIITHKAISSPSESDKVRWMWESGEIGFSDADHKYICRLDFRVRLGFGATFNVWIQYDSDERWISVSKIVGDRPTPKTETINIMPRRCEHFKFRIQGRGDFRLYTLQKIYEEGD